MPLRLQIIAFKIIFAYLQAILYVVNPLPSKQSAIDEKLRKQINDWTEQNMEELRKLHVPS